MLRESTGAKLLDMGGTVLGFLGLPISIPLFLVGTVMLFPLGLGIAVISTPGDASVDDDADATDQGRRPRAPETNPALDSVRLSAEEQDDYFRRIEAALDFDGPVAAPVQHDAQNDEA